MERTRSLPAHPIPSFLDLCALDADEHTPVTTTMAGPRKLPATTLGGSGATSGGPPRLERWSSSSSSVESPRSPNGAESMAQTFSRSLYELMRGA